jgi:hypothetical protein
MQIKFYERELAIYESVVLIIFDEAKELKDDE